MALFSDSSFVLNRSIPKSEDAGLTRSPKASRYQYSIQRVEIGYWLTGGLADYSILEFYIRRVVVAERFHSGKNANFGLAVNRYKRLWR